MAKATTKPVHVEPAPENKTAPIPAPRKGAKLAGAQSALTLALARVDNIIHQSAKSILLAHVGLEEAERPLVQALLETFGDAPKIPYTYGVHAQLKKAFVGEGTTIGKTEKASEKAFYRTLKAAKLPIPRSTALDAQQKQGERDAIRVQSDESLALQVRDAKAAGVQPAKKVLKEIERREKEKLAKKEKAKKGELKELEALLESGKFDVHAILASLKAGQYLLKMEK